MMNRYNFYNKYVVLWKSSIVKNFNYTLLLHLKKPNIVLTFTLNNVKNKDYLLLLNALYFLESVTGQRGFVSKIKNTKNFIKNSNIYKIQVNLTKYNTFFLLEIFKEFILPEIEKNEAIKFQYNITKQGNYSFVFNDLTIFPGLEEECLNWKSVLKVDFILNNRNKQQSFQYLEYLGFIECKL